MVAHGGDGGARSGAGWGDPIKPSAFGDAGKNRESGGMSGSVETMACGPSPVCVEPGCSSADTWAQFAVGELKEVIC